MVNTVISSWNAEMKPEIWIGKYLHEYPNSEEVSQMPSHEQITMQETMSIRCWIRCYLSSVENMQETMSIRCWIACFLNRTLQSYTTQDGVILLKWSLKPESASRWKSEFWRQDEFFFHITLKTGPDSIINILANVDLSVSIWKHELFTMFAIVMI
jgi:hypothetical protein